MITDTIISIVAWMNLYAGLINQKTGIALRNFIYRIC